MFQSEITGIKKILIRAPNWIGDAALCLPAIEKIKSIYPQAEITVLAKPWVSPVFLNNPFVKSIVDYDASGMHSGIFGKIRLIKDIKKKSFDMAVLFQNAFEAALIAFLARIPVRIGYDRDFRGMLLTNPVRLDSDIKKAHQVFYYLNIADSLSKSHQPSAVSHQPKIYLTEQEKKWAKDFLVCKGVGSGIIVGMAPCASYGSAKRWMAEGFSKVAGRLINDYGAKLLLFGGKDDREACNNVFKDLGTGDRFKICPPNSPILSKSVPKHLHGLNLAGEIDLRKSIALIGRCNLFITNDSGPMHIAASLGIPTVAVFGSTDPKLTGPMGDNVTVIKRNIECSPCFERECRHGHYNCLKMVTEDEVYRASIKFFQECENA